MDEKNVKNLSWKDGFVSSIDGVATTAGNEEPPQPPAPPPDTTHPTSIQTKHANPILKLPTPLPDAEKDLDSTVRKPSMDSQTFECVSTTSSSQTTFSTDIYLRKSSDNHHQETFVENESHYETIMQKSTIGNKENSNSELMEAGGIEVSPSSSSSSFEEEYYRKRQLSQYVSVTMRDMIRSETPAQRKEKLYVLVNRNAGVITHVIRRNPMFQKK